MKTTTSSRRSVGSGQTLSHILDGLGVGPATVDRIDRESRLVFDMRGMRAGQPYTAFMEHDSLGRRLRHFVYEKNPTDYIVVSLAGDLQRSGRRARR